MQYSNKRIVKNTIFLYLRMIVVLGISLFTTREVLSVLGVEDFGVYNVVAGFVSMFGFMSTMMSNSTLRFYNNRIGKVGEDGITSVYNIALIVQFIFFLLILICLETVGLWYINTQMVIPAERLSTANWLFQFAIVSLFFTMMDVPFKASIMAHERMDFFAIVSVSDAILKLLVVYLLLVLDIDSLWLYGLCTMVIAAVNLFANTIFCKTHYPKMKISLKIDKPLLKEMTSFLGWSTLGNFSFMLKEQGVNIVLNLFFGPVVNAARGITVQVVSALQQFVANNNVAVAPQMAQSYAMGDYTRSVSLFLTVSKLNFILFFLVALPVSLNIDYILNLWLKGVVPDHTSAFVILVLVCYIVNNLNSPLSNLFYATGKLKKYQIASLIILFIVPVVYLSFYLGGCPEWAFIITFFLSALHHNVGLIIMRKILPFSIKNYYYTVVFPAIILIMLCPIPGFVICNFMDKDSFECVIATTLISIAIIIILSAFIMLNKSERAMVKNMINKKINH